MPKESRTSRTLTATLASAFLVLSVVVLLVAGSIQIVFNFQTQQETVAGEQQLIAQGAASTVASFIQEKFSVLETAVKLGDLTSASEEEQKRTLQDLLGRDRAFRQLALLDSQGQALVKVSRVSQAAAEQLMDRIETGLFAQVKQGNRYISSVYIDESTSEPMVVTAIPATDIFGDFQGTLLAEVNLKFMWALVDRLEIGERGLAYVVDRQGNLLAFGDIARILRGEDVAHLKEVGEFISSSAPVDPTGASISSGINGTTIIGTYVPLGTPDWAVVTELPVSEAYQEVIRSVAISVAVILAVAMLAGLVGAYLARRLAVPLLNLTETATQITKGEVDLQAVPEGPTEVARLATAFNSMTAQLREFIGTLERQVADRTRDLEQRSTYLEATADVGRAAASILETDKLVQQVVELIRERFGLYYVGLFLVDEAGEWATLEAGTGAAGQAMLARGHRIRVGEGMIGWSVLHAESRVALEVGEDAVRLATPELPDTRSEAALPLRSRGRVFGALSVQHTQPGAFDPDTMSVLQTMADQVAIAMDNARLFTESQTALEATRRAYGEMSRRAWSETLHARIDWGYRYTQQKVAPVEGVWRPEMIQAEQSGETVGGGGGEGATLAIPLRVRDEVVGVLSFHKGTPDETQLPSGSTADAWTSEETALLQTFAAQLGQALESAQLFQETQRRAAREEMLGEIAARIRETLDVETVLKTTVQEVRQALGVPEVAIRLAARPAAQIQDGD